MSQSTTLTEKAFAPLVGPFDHFAKAWNRDLEPEPEFGLNSKRSPMMLLPGVTLATLRYIAPAVEEMHPSTRGAVTEASIRLARWRWQGGKCSAWWIAKQLEEVYFPTGIDGYRRNGDKLVRIPRKGLALLAATDVLSCSGLEWYCDVPLDDDLYEFETVRLCTALARLDRTQNRP